MTPLPIVLALPEVPYWSAGRAPTMIVFGALIGVGGARALWQQFTVLARAAVAVLLLAMPVQFSMFAGDYWSDYQERSASRFDPNATREVIAAVLELERHARVPIIFLHDDSDNKAIRWKFYTLKHARPDLWDRTQYFHADALAAAARPIGSLFVMPANDPRSAALLAAGCSLVASVRAIGGGLGSEIYRRDR